MVEEIGDDEGTSDGAKNPLLLIFICIIYWMFFPTQNNIWYARIK